MQAYQGVHLALILILVLTGHTKGNSFEDPNLVRFRRAHTQQPRPEPPSFSLPILDPVEATEVEYNWNRRHRQSNDGGVLGTVLGTVDNVVQAVDNVVENVVQTVAGGNTVQQPAQVQVPLTLLPLPIQQIRRPFIKPGPYITDPLALTAGTLDSTISNDALSQSAAFLPSFNYGGGGGGGYYNPYEGFYGPQGFSPYGFAPYDDFSSMYNYYQPHPRPFPTFYPRPPEYQYRRRPYGYGYMQEYYNSGPSYEYDNQYYDHESYDRPYYRHHEPKPLHLYHHHGGYEHRSPQHHRRPGYY